MQDAVAHVIDQLDAGQLRVASREGVGQWTVHQWIKKAVLLSFRLKDNGIMRPATWASTTRCRPSSPTCRRRTRRHRRARGAAGRGASRRVHRQGRHPDAVLRQHRRLVDEGTMVDTWATVGSCAQIGKNVHLSGGVGIGGVLEPLQANRPSSRTTASSARARKWSKA